MDWKTDRQGRQVDGLILAGVFQVPILFFGGRAGRWERWGLSGHRSRVLWLLLRPVSTFYQG